MKRNGRVGWVPVVGFFVLLVATWPGPAAAQDPEEVALVVQFEDRVETYCLDLAGEDTRGLDLLQASGLDLVVDSGGGLGSGICRIGDQGCAAPAEHCFCRCMGGGPCAYWNYFYREPGQQAWTYSPLGAALRRVRPGAVDAWVWGDGHTPPAADLTFEAICRPAATPPPSATPSPAATRRPAATAQAGPAATASPAPVASASPTAVAVAATATTPSGPTPTPRSSPPAEQETGAGGYVVFGLLAAVLAATGLFARWNRTRRR